MIIRRLIIWTLCAAFVPALAVAETTLIISRNNDVATLYFAGEAEEMVRGFDLSFALPAAATYLNGQDASNAAFDTFARNTQVEVNGTLIPATTTGALLHIADEPLPFATPFEASIATTVCLTPDLPLPNPDALRLYGGISLSVPLTEEALIVDLPVAREMSLRVRMFTRGTLIGEYRDALAPGSPLLIQNGVGGSPWAWLIGAIGAVAVALLCAFALSRPKAPRS